MQIQEQGRQLEKLLGTRTPPIAIAFREKAPEGVARIGKAQLAGCGYWRVAAEKGDVFFTQAEDHHGCPIGSHTHGVKLPPDVGAQLEGMIKTMVGLEYLKMEDVPSIPTRKDPFGVAVYSPVSKAPCDPDVVLVRGNARQLMLLAEASQAAGIAGEGPTMGRPTCAALPLAIETGATASSFGCIGNRVYTGLEDGEAYFAVPGKRIGDLLSKLGTIVNANKELEAFHKGRLA